LRLAAALKRRRVRKIYTDVDGLSKRKGKEKRRHEMLGWLYSSLEFPAARSLEKGKERDREEKGGKWVRQRGFSMEDFSFR